MGIDAKCLVFLSEFTRYRRLGRCVTLGRQHLFIEPHLLGWASRITRIPKSILEKHNGAFAESLLIEHFGASEVISIDVFNNDQPTELHDLNAPIPASLRNRFDSVLDIGTSEHVFSTKSVFGNIRDLCKVGGFIVHYVPSNNMCGHGLYQFSPTFFQSIYSEEIRSGKAKVFANFQAHETRFYKINFIPQERINIFGGGKMNLLVFAMKGSDDAHNNEVQQMDYLMPASDSSPTLAMESELKPRYRLFLILRSIPMLKIALHYVRSCRLHSFIFGWISFRKYSEAVSLADEVL